MRYKEFELTEDELFELKMSPTNLKKMAAETGAVAGIEFEMYVPGAAGADEDDYEVEPDYEMDESFPTGRGYQSEVIDFFRGGDGGSPRSTIQRALDVLSEDYWSWKDENFEEWLNDNDALLDDYLRQELPQDPDESDEEYIERLGSDDREVVQARERAMEQTREEYQNEDQFEEFLRDSDIRSMADFGSNYDVEWPYYNYPESSGGSIDIDDVASDFQSAIGRRVKSGGYHSGAGSQTDNYRVETDSSLSDPNDPTDGGLEFISPPLPLDEMLSDLEKVVKWAARNDCYTNSTTGLHMNVSVPGFELSKLDYVKLAIFLGDEYVLDQFGRAGNSYCSSAMEKIRSIAKTNPDKVLTMLQQMQGNLSAMASKIVHTGTTSKYTSINTQDGYIEFRSPGGDWLGEYAADPGKITNTLLRFTVALDVAMKPEAFRQEYMKKLYKTLSLGESNDTIQFFARYAAGALPQSALKSFVKQAQIQRKAKKLLPGAIKGQQLIQWKATSGSATATVVARTEEEARKKAAVNIGIPFTDSAIDRMDIQPLDLYTGPVNQYNIIRDDTGFDLGAFEGVDERDAITNFRVQKPQWSNTDVTARLATATQSPPDYPAATSNTPGPWTIMNQSTRRMLQSLDEPFIQASHVAAEIAMGNNIRRADIRIINTENGQVYDIDGRPTRYNTGQSDNQQSSGDQEFSGTWEVVSRPTDEVVHTISGIGNAVSDAERYANRWVDRTGFSDPVYVRPQMQPRSTGGGGFDRAPHTSIYQLVDNRDGRILLGGETRTFAYTVEMAGLAIRSYGVPSGDIRIIDMSTNRSYNINGSPVNASAPAAPTEQLYNVRWTDENGEHDVNRRAPNANAAMEDVRNSLESGGFRVASIEANLIGEINTGGSTPVPGSTEYLNRSLAAQQASAQGTESLPPGNARWLVLDRNGREVYSFVNTTAQSDANQYARQWLSANARDGQGPFDVVPVSR
jgi:hypothetical protein